MLAICQGDVRGLCRISPRPVARNTPSGVRHATQQKSAILMQRMYLALPLQHSVQALPRPACSNFVVAAGEAESCNIEDSIPVQHDSHVVASAGACDPRLSSHPVMSLLHRDERASEG